MKNKKWVLQILDYDGEILFADKFYSQKQARFVAQIMKQDLDYYHSIRVYKI